MEKLVTLAVIFAGIFIVAFVLTFLWGVGRQIVRWTVVAVAAYAVIVMALGALNSGGESAPTTIAGLLSATSGTTCAVAGSSPARSRPCTTGSIK